MYRFVCFCCRNTRVWSGAAIRRLTGCGVADTKSGKMSRRFAAQWRKVDTIPWPLERAVSGLNRWISRLPVASRTRIVSFFPLLCWIILPFDRMTRSVRKEEDSAADLLCFVGLVYLSKRDHWNELLHFLVLRYVFIYDGCVFIALCNILLRFL